MPIVTAPPPKPPKSVTLSHIGAAVSTYLESTLGFKIIEFVFYPQRYYGYTELVWVGAPRGVPTHVRDRDRFTADLHGKAASSPNSKFYDTQFVLTISKKKFVSDTPSQLHDTVLLKVLGDGTIAVHRVVSMRGGTIEYEP